MKNITTLLLVILCTTAFAQKTVYASDIINDVKAGKSIKIQNATVEGVLDFTFMDEALPKLPKRRKWWNNGGSNTVEKQIKNSISFINCTFKDNVLAYIPDENSGYTFVANFEDQVIFKDCTFKRKSMFKYSDFKDSADFSGTKFMDDSTFKYAEFNKDISFENTFFDEPATFKYAEFNRFVSFANATFKETAVFKYTDFGDGVSFNNVQFEEDLDIKYVKVSGKFDITNMDVGYTIDSKYASINGKSFNKYLLKNR